MSAATPAHADVCVLIPAAGQGERLGLGPKALLPLHGRPVIEWLAEKTRAAGAEVLVACAPGMDAPAGCLRIEGGATRQESVRRLAEAATRPWSLLWDAASPFASLALARAVLAAAAQGGGAATSSWQPEVPCYALEPGPVITRPCDGAVVWSQTPQAYATALLREVTARAGREHWAAQSTVQLVLRAGHAVAAVRGEKLNLKLTTPDDWLLAQALRAHLSS